MRPLQKACTWGRSSVKLKSLMCYQSLRRTGRSIWVTVGCTASSPGLERSWSILLVPNTKRTRGQPEIACMDLARANCAWLALLLLWLKQLVAVVRERSRSLEFSSAFVTVSHRGFIWKLKWYSPGKWNFRWVEY